MHHSDWHLLAAGKEFTPTRCADAPPRGDAVADLFDGRFQLIV